MTAPSVRRVLPQRPSSYAHHIESIQGSIGLERFYSGFAAWYRGTLPDSRTAKLLDFGAGRGDLLRWLRSMEYEDLTGFDVIDDYREAVERDVGARLVVGTDGCTFLREAPARYDWIMFKDVLEHVCPEEALSLLAAARHALRPGGTVVVSGPHAASPAGIYTRYADYTHRSCFTLPSLEYALRSAEFEDIQCVTPRLEWSWRPSAIALRCARQMWFTALRVIHCVELPGEPPPPHFWPRIAVYARTPSES